jgi:Ca2+-binding RTX toxin-like protein
MNIISGTLADDTLTGTAGNDYIDGSTGADTMSGLAGNDVYIVDNINDVVIENSGEGTDRVNSTVDYTLPSNVEDLWLVGTADVSGVGNALGNTMWGNSGANSLTGLGGDDYLDGGTGADTMAGGTGNDTYWVDNSGDVVTENAGEGNDTVESSSASYTLTANVENLILIAGKGSINGTGNELDNAITGNEGDNVLIGAAGNDTLDGGTGADTMVGGTGDDTFYVDNAGDVVTENPGEGTDIVISTLANYTLADNVENLSLGKNYYTSENLNGTGNALDNTIRGNQGDNVLDGAGGDDTLVGGDGNDTLIGGTGHDTFYISTTDAGTDTITDLSVGDVVLVCGVIFSGSITDGDGSTAQNGDVQVSTANGQTVLHIGTDDTTGADLSIVLDGTYEAQYFHTQGFNLWYDTNHAPEQNVAIPDQAVYTSNACNFQVPANAFSDADGDTLTYSANVFDWDLGIIDLPSWLHFDSSSGIFTGTPANGDVGSFMVMITATDPSGASAYSVFNFNVNQSTDGTSGADVLTGTSGVDALNGFAGNDTLNGGGGNDILNGGLGADVMLGGAGNDTYVVDNVSDKVIETTTQSSSIDAGGIDTVQSSISWTLGNFVENLTLTGSADINGTGNALANTLTGNGGNNLLDGKAGADTMAGGLGNDTYVVDNAGDTVVEQSNGGTDLVKVAIAASGGTWTLAANVENGTITSTVAFNLVGNGLDNVLTGNGAVNVLTGGDGNDTLNGGAGADSLYGGAGNDTYVVDNASDKVLEVTSPVDATDPGGIDTVLSSVTFTLGSNLENLTLTGTSSLTGNGNGLDNLIVGNGAANKLFGFGGSDSLHGGLGNDVLWGGGGADAFVFDSALNASSNVDKVMDFNEGEGDVIVLAAGIFTALGGSVTADEIRSGAGITTAATASQRLIYNSTTGNLYYDKDGAGGSAAVLFATIDLVGNTSSHPASMGAADFLIQ